MTDPLAVAQREGLFLHRVALLDSDRQTARLAGASTLGEHGPPAVEPLCRTLWDKDKQVRVAAAQSLGQIRDVRALASLCAALQDTELEVRAAAADALGQIGDDRAVGPLIQSLKSSFNGGSGRRHLFLGWAGLIPALLYLLVMLASMILVVIGLFVGVCFIARAFLELRRLRSHATRTITAALERIAERNPTPEVRRILPDLEAVSLDLLQHTQEARVASRATAAHIRALTKQSKSLPVPATASPAAEALPLPADAPSPDARLLPRVEAAQEVPPSRGEADHADRANETRFSSV